MSEQDPMDQLRVATFEPQDCSTQGGETLVITFSSSLPDDPFVIILNGSDLTHKLQPHKEGENILTAQLPAHSTPEPVQFSVYWLPSSTLTATYQAILLLQDVILYSDKSHSLLAEQLIHSVVDETQATLFYSMLPPLVTMDITSLCEFDNKLRHAVAETELPHLWRMTQSGHAHQDTLLHFAARYNLPHLFSLLLTLPGGREAVQVCNEGLKYPVDLAKESGSHEITRILEGLERQSSSLASLGTTTSSVSTLSLSERKTSPYLTIMRGIDGDWIHRQTSKNSLCTTTLHKRAGSTSGHTPRPYSFTEGINEGEISPTSCWLCANRSSRKSWSRVLGESRCRSVDTGMNELDRITDQILAHERLQEVRTVQCPSSVTKGDRLDRWSFSCPMLNEEVESISADLIHSTLTSPGIFEGPAFLSDFTAPFVPSDNDPLCCIPHQSLLMSGNHGNEDALSPGGGVVLPEVCIVDEHMSRVCLEMGVARDDRTLKANNIHRLPSDSSDEQDGGVVRRDTGGVPTLSSQSMPTFYPTEEKDEVLSEDVQTTPTKLSKSYSTPMTLDKRGGVKGEGPEQIEEDEEPEDDYMTSKSAILFSSPTPSPIHDSTTPTSTPPTVRKTHQKSLSVSNVAYQFEEDEEGNLPLPSDNQSRGSSFISTSSKMDTSDSSEESEGEEDDFEPPGGGGVALLNAQKKTELVYDNEGAGSSGEDYLDGLRVKGYRQDRRMSEIRMTMIDDYSGSDEEAGQPRLPRSSTADDVLSQSLGDQRCSPLASSPSSSSPFLLKNNTCNIALSDIEVSVESLNNSFSNERGSPVFRRETSSKNSFSPHESPKGARGQYTVTTDPKRTIKHLQTLLKIEKEEVPVFEGSNASDDSDRETDRLAKTRKSLTLPSNSPILPTRSPNTFRKSPLLSHKESSTIKEHMKVSRNASTASDSKVPYTRSEFSSLDFIKPSDGQTSPRVHHHSHGDVPSSVATPHSPLFFTRRSPRVSEDGCTEGSTVTSPVPLTGSPLEKRVSKSADNLLSSSKETSSVESKQEQQSPTKGKEKEEPNSNVRLLRFEPLPETEANTDEETNRKDIRTYYGMEQEKEQPKKSFKLFRRDSKKEKKTKKLETSSSIDTNGTSGGGRPTRTQHSPNQRKPRSATIHGDACYPPVPLIPSNDEPVSTKPAKRLSQQSLKQQPPRESISPVREESLSPSPLSPSERQGEAESDKSLSIKIDDFPELMPSEEADVSWNKTVDRRLRKQMSKHEKGRQGVIYDWITTERHMFRAYQILNKVFYEKFRSELKMTEDDLNQLFPSLHTVLQISQEFLRKLQERQQQSGALIQDISDILLEQFTGPKGERMKKAYTDFICLYPATMELYREMEKKKHFNRVITALYQNKLLERKKLPDFYLLITQRVSKYVEMMKKLVKETEALKLDNLPRVKESSVALTTLVNSIDRGVYEYNSHKDLTEIQSRLEISVPKQSAKSKKLKGIKLLDFTAQNRFLLRRGDTSWQGHGKQIGVQIILVTDLLVLLTERDQKYHLATLQDLQPPVIKLYDLHVRVNAAVKSGVQLLLLEQGLVPEMFRLEFPSKKQAKDWEEALNTAIHYCKENQLKCEYFGSEPVLSGDESLREEEEDKGEGPDPVELEMSDSSPNTYRRFMVSMAMESANRILALGHPVSGSLGGSMMTIDEVKESPKPSLKNSKSLKATTQRTVSIEEPKQRKKNKQVERGRSFLDKKMPQEDPNDRPMLLDCILKLKESLELVLDHSDEQDAVIKRLKKEIEALKEERRSDDTGSSPATPRSQRGSSFSRNRPHSLHSDMFVVENGNN